jgi:hypothetical protein
MPLEVNEIGINMRVSDNLGLTDTERKTNGRRPKKAPENDCHDVKREEIVDDCVRRVLQILKTVGGR